MAIIDEELGFGLDLVRALRLLRSAPTEDELARGLVGSVTELVHPRACALSRDTTAARRRMRLDGVVAFELRTHAGAPWRLEVSWATGRVVPRSMTEAVQDLVEQATTRLDQLRTRASDEQPRVVPIDGLTDAVVIARLDGSCDVNAATIGLMELCAGVSDPWDLDLRERTGLTCAREQRPLYRALHHDETITHRELALPDRRGQLVPVLVSAFPSRRAGGGEREAVEVLQRIHATTDHRAALEQRIGLVAHELRQAAGALCLAEDRLERNAGPIPAGRLGAIGARVTRLASVLTGEEAMEPPPTARKLVDFARLVVEEAGPERTIAADRCVELAIADGLPRISGDEISLRQVLSNLLDNAVKYGAPTAPILVALAARASAVELRITNRGARVDRDAMPMMFRRYFRAHARGPAQPATSHGLGLSLCREIVTAHGGSISFDSTAGVTTVRVLLPADPQGEAVDSAMES